MKIAAIFIFLFIFIESSFCNEWQSMIPDNCWEMAEGKGFVLEKESPRYKKLYQRNPRDFLDGPKKRSWKWNWGRIKTAVQGDLNALTECKKEIFVASRNDLLLNWKSQVDLNCSKSNLKYYRQMARKSKRVEALENIPMKCGNSLNTVHSISLMNKYYQNEIFLYYRCKRVGKTGVLDKTRSLASPIEKMVMDTAIMRADMEPPKPKPNPCWTELTCKDKVMMSSVISAVSRARNDEERLEFYQEGMRILKENNLGETASRMSRYFHAKSAEIQAKKSLKRNTRKIRAALNSNVPLKSGFQELALKAKEIQAHLENIRGEVSGWSLAGNTLMSMSRKVSGTVGLEAPLQSSYESKLALQSKLLDELKSIKTRLKLEYSNYIMSSDLNLGQKQIQNSKENFDTFLTSFTQPLFKGIEDGYDEAAGVQGAIGKISDSIIALDVIVMGVLLPVPVAKNAALGCGVNLLTTQVKDLVGSATDAFGSSSGSFWCSYTQKGLEEVQQGKGRFDSQKVMDCGIGAVAGAAFPPILASGGKLATVAKVGGAGMMTYAAGTELALSGSKFFEAIGEDNFDIKRCLTAQGTQHGLNLVTDIAMIGAEGYVVGKTTSLKFDGPENLAPPIGSGSIDTKRVGKSPSEIEFSSSDNLSSLSLSDQKFAEKFIEDANSNVALKLFYEQATGNIQYSPPGFLGKDKRTGDRLYQFLHPKTGDAIILTHKQYKNMSDRVNSFLALKNSAPKFKAKGFSYEMEFTVGGNQRKINVDVPLKPDGTEDVAFIKDLTATLEKMPPRILETVGDIQVNPRANKEDGHWKIVYKDFTGAAATAGGGLKGTGEINIFPGGRGSVEKMSDLLSHELGHTFAFSRYGNTTPSRGTKYDAGLSYSQAKNYDGNQVSQYGSNSEAEDYAEALSFYIRSKGGFANFNNNGAQITNARSQWPKRFEYFDKVFGIDDGAKLVAQRNNALFEQAIERANVQLSILGGRVVSVAIGNTVILIGDDDKLGP